MWWALGKQPQSILNFLVSHEFTSQAVVACIIDNYPICREKLYGRLRVLKLIKYAFAIIQTYAFCHSYQGAVQ